MALSSLRILSKHIQYALKHDWRKSGRGIRRALVCAGVAFAHAFLFATLLGSRLEVQMLHEWFGIRGQRPAPSSVTVVRLDEPAYEKINLLPGEKFPRRYMAEGIERIAAASPKLIITDMFFRREGNDPEADQLLAKALTGSPSVIGRYTEDITDTDFNGMQRHRRLVNAPLELFANSAKAVIPLEVRVSDGVVEEICLSNEHFVLSDINVPLVKPLQQFVDPTVTEPGGSDYINFYGGPFTLTNLSFARVLGNDTVVPAEYFKDRVVFVGLASDAGVGVAAGKDTFITSVSKLPMYGVEIQATIAANLLDRSWIKKLTPEREVTLLNLTAFAVTFISLSFSPLVGTLLTVGLGAWWLFASYYCFVYLYYFLPGATLFLAIMPAFTVLRWTLGGYFSGEAGREVRRLSGADGESEE